MEAIPRIASRPDVLPALPSVVAEIAARVANATTSAAQLADLIMRDPALTTRLLRLVNSPFFGLPRSIGNPREATLLLGFQAIRDLALATVVLDLFPAEASAAFDPYQLWRHAIATAVAARLLAAQVADPAPDELFVAGLLHDVGKILLYRHDRPTFDAVLTSARQHDAPVWASEQRLTGTTHALIGAQLLRHWRLPARLVAAVGEHHASAPGKVAQLIQAADALARVLGLPCGMDDAVPAARGALWPAWLGPREHLTALVDRCATQYEEVAALLFTRA